MVDVMGVVDDEQNAAREDIRAAVAKMNRAREELMAAVRRARDAKLTITEIAKLSEVTRETVYTRLREADAGEN